MESSYGVHSVLRTDLALACFCVALGSRHDFAVDQDTASADQVTVESGMDETDKTCHCPFDSGLDFEDAFLYGAIVCEAPIESAVVQCVRAQVHLSTPTLHVAIHSKKEHAQ